MATPKSRLPICVWWKPASWFTEDCLSLCLHRTEGARELSTYYSWQYSSFRKKIFPVFSWWLLSSTVPAASLPSNLCSSQTWLFVLPETWDAVSHLPLLAFELALCLPFRNVISLPYSLLFLPSSRPRSQVTANPTTTNVTLQSLGQCCVFDHNVPHCMIIICSPVFITKLYVHCFISFGIRGPRQHIKKQRHYFANKGSLSQSYGFSSSHV